jgi:anti-sigma-K factor RskA
VVRLLRPDLHTLTGAYAVDAVDGAEREKFEHHLRRCSSCEHEVLGMQETATRLGLAAARVPPPSLKTAVMASAARTRQHPPVAEASPAPEPRARWRPRLAVAVATLAAAVIVALAVTLGLQHSELDQSRAQQREVAAVLTAPGARLVTAPTSLGGTATVVVAQRLGKMIFTSSGLPALADAKVYQVWILTSSGGATSAGLVPGAVNGQTAPLLAAGPPPGDQVGVTVEPAGGTKAPTTKPIVVLGFRS